MEAFAKQWCERLKPVDVSSLKGAFVCFAVALFFLFFGRQPPIDDDEDGVQTVGNHCLAGSEDCSKEEGVEEKDD